MQTQEQPSHRRKRVVLLLRDEPARLPAIEETGQPAQDRFWRGRCHPCLARNQFFSRHPRSSTRARYMITKRLVAVMESALQISSESSSITSRIMNTRAVLGGSWSRQKLMTSKNSLRSRSSSGLPQLDGALYQCRMCSKSAYRC